MSDARLTQLALDKSVREGSAVELYRLHRERDQISGLLDTGVSLRTVQVLYPFDIEEYAPSLCSRLAHRPHFRLFAHNALEITIAISTETRVITATHREVEAGYEAWGPQRGSAATLEEVLRRRLDEAIPEVGLANSFSSVSWPAVQDPERVQLLAFGLYEALAFAHYGALEPQLHMSSSLKNLISHVLIYLTSAEVYGRWGAKHRV